MNEREPQINNNGSSLPLSHESGSYVNIEKLEKHTRGYWGKGTMEECLHLAKELAPNVEQHKYQLVIGDDPSARAVALIVGSFIKNKYESDGSSGPKRVFIAGGYRDISREWPVQYDENFHRIIKEETDQELADRLKKNDEVTQEFFIKLSEYAQNLKKKFTQERVSALFVTEIIVGSGRTKKIIDIFKDAGIDCDVAVLNDCRTDYVRKLNIIEREKLFIGGFAGTDFHHDTYGVRKNNISSDVHGILDRRTDGSYTPDNELREECKNMGTLMLYKTFAK